MFRAFVTVTRQTRHVIRQELVFPVWPTPRDTDGMQGKKIRGCVMPVTSTSSAAKHVGVVLILVEDWKVKFLIVQFSLTSCYTPVAYPPILFGGGFNKFR
jgi:hypothetical protein